VTPEERFAAVMDAFRSREDISAGKMFASPGLKVRGKIFSMLVKDRLVLKLPKGRVDEIVSSGAGEYFDPGHGRLMKEWVALAGDADLDWTTLSQEALDFVGGRA
jgi:TfoX/Sxy family transcriptional regulator of competence genes